jgi:hypothetical protein
MYRPGPFLRNVLTLVLAVGGATFACAQAPAPRSACGTPPAAGAATAGLVDLRQKLDASALTAVNRRAAALDGSTNGVYVDAGGGPGVVWITGTDLGAGTIAVDVCGRDVLQQSFLGVAFHRKDDRTYEAVYLRPFNFRADDPARHQHAVQYIAVPDFDWPRLRAQFPEEFENPVDASIDPAAWIRLRVVVTAQRVQVFAGATAAPALEVRRLGTTETGAVGLWVGNGSDGGFANLRVTPSGTPPAAP